MAGSVRDENYDMRLAATALFSRYDKAGEPAPLSRIKAATFIGYLLGNSDDGGLGTGIFTLPIEALKKAGCNMAAWEKSNFALNANKDSYLIPEEFVVNGALPILKAWAGKDTQHKR
jgi:hypothetical protein